MTYATMAATLALIISIAALMIIMYDYCELKRQINFLPKERDYDDIRNRLVLQARAFEYYRIKIDLLMEYLELEYNTTPEHSKIEEKKNVKNKN